MKEIFPTIYQYIHESPFGTRYSYLLTTSTDNVLIPCGLYDADNLETIRQLGGIDHILITDRDFAKEYIDDIVKEFNCSVFCHKQEHQPIYPLSSVA